MLLLITLKPLHVCRRLLWVEIWG
ncbi:hypothetical protein Gotur_024769 [Gossypium turneri]